jgi:peptidoglycan/xylan/chitin deacetylase (PgdA/CDA1 family)
MCFNAALWRADTSEKKVFLTFDDGPVPGVTPWVIEQLEQYGFKGTFFCVGDNIRKYPRIFQLLNDAGMAVGNHTFSHVPGSRLSLGAYLKDVERAQEYCGGSPLFRPPHGLIWPWWMPALKKRFSEVVFWDILSRDYDRSLSPQLVIDGVIENIRPGSIIVFHDSLKAWPNLKFALPKVLEWLHANGFTSGALA